MLKEWYEKRTVKQLNSAKTQFYKDLKDVNRDLSERNIRMIWNNIRMINTILHKGFPWVG